MICKIRLYDSCQQYIGELLHNTSSDIALESLQLAIKHLNLPNVTFIKICYVDNLHIYKV